MRRPSVPWWVLARNLGIAGLGVAAVGGWANGLIDELGDQRATSALADQNDRQAYEQECRFDLAQPVTELDSQQLDVLVDLAIARGAGDAEGLRTGLAELAQIREAKATAVRARAGAVAECSRRADRLFGGDGS
jgi:hypothetical protein